MNPDSLSLSQPLTPAEVAELANYLAKRGYPDLAREVLMVGISSMVAEVAAVVGAEAVR